MHSAGFLSRRKRHLFISFFALLLALTLKSVRQKMTLTLSWQTSGVRICCAHANRFKNKHAGSSAPRLERLRSSAAMQMLMLTLGVSSLIKWTLFAFSSGEKAQRFCVAMCLMCQLVVVQRKTSTMCVSSFFFSSNIVQNFWFCLFFRMRVKFFLKFVFSSFQSKS